MDSGRSSRKFSSKVFPKSSKKVLQEVESCVDETTAGFNDFDRAAQPVQQKFAELSNYLDSCTLEVDDLMLQVAEVAASVMKLVMQEMVARAQ